MVKNNAFTRAAVLTAQRLAEEFQDLAPSAEQMAAELPYSALKLQHSNEPRTTSIVISFLALSTWISAEIEKQDEGPLTAAQMLILDGYEAFGRFLLNARKGEFSPDPLQANLARNLALIFPAAGE